MINHKISHNIFSFLSKQNKHEIDEGKLIDFSDENDPKTGHQSLFLNNNFLESFDNASSYPHNNNLVESIDKSVEKGKFEMLCLVKCNYRRFFLFNLDVQQL